MTPYKTAALRYYTHGWQGPLPVGDGPQQKTAPPTGYTGSTGAWPDEDQIAEWTRTKADHNIGLRLPTNVVGIDVDGYDNKPGVFTMKATAEHHGKLPRTWTSTSRSDMSGIRWFRITPGQLPGKLVHPDNDNQSGVEVIQHHHRYAVVPPSIHPSGRPYQWITPDGEPVTDGRLPKPSDLPELPQAWVDHIRKTCSCWIDFDWNRYRQTDRRDPVADTYDKWSARMNEAYGRHDAATGGTMALIAFAARGWPGADDYLRQLEQDFYSSLGDTRNRKEAEAEWSRMVEGARTKAATTTIPQWQDRTQPAPPATPEELDARIAEELDKLRVRHQATELFRAEQRDAQPIPQILTLRERLANPQPDLAWRIEGWQPADTRVLLSAQFKAGKTTLTGNLARCLVDNQTWLGTSHVTPARRVAILDFEMGERQIDQWLEDQGIINDDRILIGPLRGRSGSFDILDDQTRTQWAERLTGCDYLILDCLRPILDALGLDEHKEGGRFLTAFDALCDEAGIADALIVHHMGHAGERARGDSRFRDWPDVEWRLVRESDDPASPRYLAAYGRDVEQAESQLAFDENTRHLTLLGGNRSNAAARRALEDVLMWLAAHGPATKKTAEAAITEEFDHTQKAVRAAFELGLRDGMIFQKRGANNRHELSVPANDLASSSVRHSSSQFVNEQPVSSSVRLRTDELASELTSDKNQGMEAS